jgi:hypothetical protein
MATPSNTVAKPPKYLLKPVLGSVEKGGMCRGNHKKGRYIIEESPDIL